MFQTFPDTSNCLFMVCTFQLCLCIWSNFLGYSLPSVCRLALYLGCGCHLDTFNYYTSDPHTNDDGVRFTFRVIRVISVFTGSLTFSSGCVSPSVLFIGYQRRFSCKNRHTLVNRPLCWIHSKNSREKKKSLMSNKCPVKLESWKGVTNYA